VTCDHWQSAFDSQQSHEIVSQVAQLQCKNRRFEQHCYKLLEEPIFCPKPNTECTTVKYMTSYNCSLYNLSSLQLRPVNIASRYLKSLARQLKLYLTHNEVLQTPQSRLFRPSMERTYSAPWIQRTNFVRVSACNFVLNYFRITSVILYSIYIIKHDERNQLRRANTQNYRCKTDVSERNYYSNVLQVQYNTRISYKSTDIKYCYGQSN
jgi:hypothetical protein